MANYVCFAFATEQMIDKKWQFLGTKVTGGAQLHPNPSASRQQAHPDPVYERPAGQVICVAVLWHGNIQFLMDRESAIFGVWAAQGAPETLPKGRGLRPPPFGRGSGAPGAAQTLKMTDFRSLNKVTFL